MNFRKNLYEFFNDDTKDDDLTRRKKLYKYNRESSRDYRI